MDPHDRALHMREHLKQIYRARLPDIGWCDDNTRRKQQVDSIYSEVRGDWEVEANQYQSVAAAALEASTTDNEHQAIDMTMPNDRSFWSSSGHPTQVAYEALLYELTGPACKVVSIKMAPYRALYQDGYPVYPPMRLQVWVGASPYSLQPASPWHDVQASDALQTFAIWPHAPVGRFLQIRMYGKLQKQREDMQFYIALRHVDITGAALSTPELLALQPLLRSNTLQLAAPTPGASGTCVEALQAAADFGLGPEQAVDATAVHAHMAAAGQSPQQQGRRDRWSRIEARPKVLQQCQSQQSAEWLSAQQQRQQQGTAVQRVTAGIRSILGRRGAAAAAVAGSSEAGPSKRPQQQQLCQPPALLLPDQQQARQQQQPRRGTPLWLCDVVPAEVGMMQPPQQQQQQQMPRVAGEHGGSSSNSSHSRGGQVEAMANKEHPLGEDHMLQEPARVAADAGGSDGAGTDEHDMVQVAAQQDAQEEQQQDAQMWPELGADAARATQRLTEQIVLRLQNAPPWQQEQVLADLLADEPTGGRAGRQAYRQHLAELQAQLQQQQAETAPLLAAAEHPPPIVAILPTKNACGSCSAQSYELPQASAAHQDAEWVVKVRALLDQGIDTTRWFESAAVDEALQDMHGLGEDDIRLRQRYMASCHAAAAAAIAAEAAASGSAAMVSGQYQTAAVPASSSASAAATSSFALTAGHLFKWQTPGSSMGSTGAGADAVAGICSRRALSASLAGRTQWLAPASCFCEGLEADVWVCR